MKINLYEGDVPNNFKVSHTIAIDTETMGLNPNRDRLCLVQLSNGDNVCHLVKIDSSKSRPKNLINILKNNKIQKIFHFARFDVAVFKFNFKIKIKNIYCTKISKNEQSSDWGGKLTIEQQKYAATDVFYLHELREKLNVMLIREKRVKLAQACFDFIEHRTDLDIIGWQDIDIFRH